MGPLPQPEEGARRPLPQPEEAALEPWAVGALAVATGAALPWLVRVPVEDGPVPLGPGLRWWAAAARLVAAILAGGRYLPAIESDPDGEWAAWEPAWTAPR